MSLLDEPIDRIKAEIDLTLATAFNSLDAERVALMAYVDSLKFEVTIPSITITLRRVK